MDLWNRICTNLKASQVLVEDVSRKRFMDLRLLHGVAYGHSWFGRWGYRSCFGYYNEAIEYLGSLKIDDIARDLSKTKCHKEVNEMIRCYRDMSETQITTISDLLSFMLTEIRTNIMKDKSLTKKEFNTIVANMDSRWPQWKLEYAAQEIVDALKSGSGSMTRQDVIDAAMLHIGDTDLLDHVLKSLNNVIVENYVVCKMMNLNTGNLEYTIHKHGNGTKEHKMEPELMAHLDHKEESSRMPGNDVNIDVLYVYKNVLLGYPDSEKVESAVQKILDSRHFVKNFGLMDENEQVLTFICKLKPTVAEIEYDLREPGCRVTVMVSLYATVGDLKKAAEAALRDIYCIAERLRVLDIAELMGMSDEEGLVGLGSGLELCVKVTDIDLCTPFKYQSGADNRKVRCKCGAEDDNGERMVACQICGMWQHIRCIDTDDSQTLQPVFLCKGCWNPQAPES